MRPAFTIAVVGLLASLGAVTEGTSRVTPPPGADEFADLTFEPPWPVGADLNGDWALDAYDLLEMAIDFGPCDEPCPGDLDGSGTIDLIDLLMLMAEIEPSPALASTRLP